MKLLRKVLQKACGLERRLAAATQIRVKRRIHAILADSTPRDTALAEANFERIQAEAPGNAEYGYDRLTVWRRAVERASVLLTELGDCAEHAKTLEVGCGDGVVSRVLSDYGVRATLLDSDDWRHEPAKRLPFVRGELEATDWVELERYDLIFSYNTFEHVNAPDKALSNLAASLRPGGRIVLSFNPLYASPWGLHAYRSLYMPYPQHLFSDAFVTEQLQRIGIRDLGVERTALQPMNQWRVEQFRRLWDDSGLHVKQIVETKIIEHLDYVFRFPASFRGLSLSYDDLVIGGIHVVLAKPHHHDQ